MENCRERGDKNLVEEYFNLSEEIMQRSESKGARTQSIHSQNKRSVDLPVDRHAQFGAQQQFGWLSGRPTGTSLVSVGVRSIDRSTEARVGRPSG